MEGRGKLDFEYQRNGVYFAQVTGLMEEICEKELIELGALNTKPVYRGIYFEADARTLYKINYTSRMITRVLAPLRTFSCHSTDALKKMAEKIPWDELFSVDETFAISASVSKSKINNSLFASLCLKDGIADYFRNKFDKRPNVEKQNPDIRFNLHIDKNIAVISLDTSGESLHKRGYRLLAGEAPMQETLAAALIKISNWDGERPLLDCMCGSGTILCEALMSYCKIPAQKMRKKFGFFNMPEFKDEIWKEVKDSCDRQIRELPKGLINGSDISPEAVKVAKANLSHLPYSDSVEILCKPFQRINSFENGTLIVNPPYGLRLGKTEEVKALYKELGDFLKSKCNGTSAFIFTGEPSLRKSVGLKTSLRVSLTNGKLEGVVFRVECYLGSKKGGR